MRHGRALALLGACLVYTSLVGCTATEPTPTDRSKVAASVMEVPVIPDEPSVNQEPQPSESPSEVQERGVMQLAPGLVAPKTAVLGALSPPLASGLPRRIRLPDAKRILLHGD